MPSLLCSTGLTSIYTRISNLPLLSVVAVAISSGLAAASALFAGLAGASTILLAEEALLWDFCEICASMVLICCSICFVFVSLVLSSSELASILSSSASSFALCFSSALVSVVLDVEVEYDVDPETADKDRLLGACFSSSNKQHIRKNREKSCACYHNRHWKC